MKTPYETIPVAQASVSCDGGGGALGHPKVYLHIDPDVGHILCPYCSRNYLLKAALKIAAH